VNSASSWCWKYAYWEPQPLQFYHNYVHTDYINQLCVDTSLWIAWQPRKISGFLLQQFGTLCPQKLNLKHELHRGNPHQSTSHRLLPSATPRRKNLQLQAQRRQGDQNFVSKIRHKTQSGLKLSISCREYHRYRWNVCWVALQRTRLATAIRRALQIAASLIVYCSCILYITVSWYKGSGLYKTKLTPCLHLKKLSQL
jgi:hypothetical protein